jgi:hypothetical protein
MSLIGLHPEKNLHKPITNEMFFDSKMDKKVSVGSSENQHTPAAHSLMD